MFPPAVEGFEKRVVYNASKAYVMQLHNADEYPVLCDVVGMTICNFDLWPEQDDCVQFKVPMLSPWRMLEQHSGERGLSQVQYAFLELPKYAAGDAPTTLVDRWAYFFREATNLTVVPPVLAEEPFRAALEVARAANFSSAEWDAYQQAKMAEQDARGALTVARQEGSPRATGPVSSRPSETRCFASSPRGDSRSRRTRARRSRPARISPCSTGGSRMPCQRRPSPTCFLEAANHCCRRPRDSVEN